MTPTTNHKPDPETIHAYTHETYGNHPGSHVRARRVHNPQDETWKAVCPTHDWDYVGSLEHAMDALEAHRAGRPVKPHPWPTIKPKSHAAAPESP